jgi:hypothetical protein
VTRYSPGYRARTLDVTELHTAVRRAACRADAGLRKPANEPEIRDDGLEFAALIA